MLAISRCTLALDRKQSPNTIDHLLAVDGTGEDCTDVPLSVPQAEAISSSRGL
jgi:hypothetical protein